MLNVFWSTKLILAYVMQLKLKFPLANICLLFMYVIVLVNLHCFDIIFQAQSLKPQSPDDFCRRRSCDTNPLQFTPAAFSDPNPNIELALFYQKFLGAPPLKSRPDHVNVSNHLSEIVEQIQCFNNRMKEFDRVVLDLCHDDSE